MRIVLCLVTIFSCSGCALATLPSSRYSVHVTDTETGAPVTNAFVQTTFQHDYDPWGNRPNKVDRRKSPVDGDGRITFLGETMESGIGCSVYADGYYPDWAGIEVTEKNVLLNRWEPWNPTFEVKMRPKKNPVPMVSKGWHRKKIPVWGKAVGFDFERGDWVAPYGKGIICDIMFNARRKDPDAQRGALCNITFSNPMDGIQEYFPPKGVASSFIFPYEAPVSGYRSHIFREEWYSDKCGLKKVSNAKEYKKINHLFRVRTQVDAKGNITLANYGRIQGDVRISSSGLVYFSYWFNPDPKSRSLESLEEPY